MPNTVPNAGKCKWLLQGRGSQIQKSNKTIIEFGSCRIGRIIKASVCVITQISALIIPHISYSTSFNNCLIHAYIEYICTVY